MPNPHTPTSRVGQGFHDHDHLYDAKPTADLTPEERSTAEANMAWLGDWILARVQEVRVHAARSTGPCDPWCIGPAATAQADQLDRDQAVALVILLLRMSATQ